MSTELEKLHAKIRQCKKCRLSKNGKTVPGEGSDNAKIMFIGEAPGRVESETGRPFVGRAGQLLTELIESIDLKRPDVFITSPVKHRPPNNRRPKGDEIEACIPYLWEQIKIIKPKVIVLLGNTAIRTILGKMEGINRIHSKTIRKDGKIYFLTFHPAAGIRATRNKLKLQQDFKKLKNLLNQNEL
jgi:uracil-DNA glycosylase family 4